MRNSVHQRCTVARNTASVPIGDARTMSVVLGNARVPCAREDEAWETQDDHQHYSTYRIDNTGSVVMHFPLFILELLEAIFARLRGGGARGRRPGRWSPRPPRQRR